MGPPAQAACSREPRAGKAVSPESFAAQYEFLLGEAPAVVDILPEAERVTISGRAVVFPENTGTGGRTLQVWEIDSDTGERLRSEPQATFEIGADGAWGPMEVACGRQHYEKTLIVGETSVQHFYFQPYLRSTSLVRLLSGEPDGNTAQNTHSARITPPRS